MTRRDERNDATSRPSASLESRLWRSNAREFGVQAVAVFVAAGTLRYWQARTMLAVRLVPVVITNST